MVTAAISFAMTKMAATRLSDGRIQLWVLSPTLLSSWQTSLNPALPWAPLSAFNPSPPPNGQGTSISAGHSPDGRVQLWVYGDDGTLRTTWKKTGDSNSGWFPWEPFPAAGDYAPAVGQLKDGRMQLFGTNPNYSLMTNWKVSTKPDAAWSGWTELNPNPPSSDVGAALEAGAAFYIAAGSLSDGRLQVWTRAGTRVGGGVTGGQILQSVWQTTTDPTQPWSSWKNPFVPQLVAPPGQPPGGNVVCFAAGQILDGRTQLYGATDDGILQTTFKTSATDPNSAWNGNWFPLANNPGLVQDVTAARLEDGSAQIWVWVNSPGSPTAEIWTSRQVAAIEPTGGAIFGPWSSIGTVQE